MLVLVLPRLQPRSAAEGALVHQAHFPVAAALAELAVRAEAALLAMILTAVVPVFLLISNKVTIVQNYWKTN